MSSVETDVLANESLQSTPMVRRAVAGWRVEPVPATQVQDVLHRCGLSAHDPFATMPTRFWGVQADGQWVACVGLEMADGVGWLRSLAVLPPWRGQGLAGVLCDQLESFAAQGGLSALYLLTTSADTWFARRGYARLARDQAPAALQRFRQFAETCPAQARLMGRPLPRPTGADEDAPPVGAWRLPTGRALLLHPTAPRTLQLLRGRAWVTLGQGLGEPDRVLMAGDRLDVPPGVRLVIEPWTQPADGACSVMFDWLAPPLPAASPSRFRCDVVMPLQDAALAVRVLAHAGIQVGRAAGRVLGALGRAAWGLLGYGDWLLPGRGAPQGCMEQPRA